MIMSRYSGRYDFHDLICDHGMEKISKADIYTYDKNHERVFINIECVKDCVKYYPYIITQLLNIEGNLIIQLSDEDWISTEERRYGHTPGHDFQRQLWYLELLNRGYDKFFAYAWVYH